MILIFCFCFCVYNKVINNLNRRMSIFVPCCIKFFRLFFQTKLIQKNDMIKKYSNIDVTPPIEENDSQQLQLQLPNNYSSLNNADITVLPNVDLETSNDACFRNLLINKCQNSSFVIMRSLQNVYVDTCAQDFIFVGPCHSTLFIRNCKNMKIRAIAQQLRIENSENIEIEALIGVNPVLQDCKSIRFYSLNCRLYVDLLWQIQKAKINIFSNQIYQCYDFTPKKTPNFINSQIMQQRDDQNWETKIEQNQLDWGFKCIYLPKQTSVKKSMLKKVYDENELKKNLSYVIIFTKMLLKQFLIALNSPQFCKNITVILNMSAELCLRILSNKQGYKAKIKQLDKREGTWYFMLIKIESPKEKGRTGFFHIEDRNLLYKLFKQNL